MKKDFANTQIKCSYQEKYITDYIILTVQFKGKYRYGSQGNPDADFMETQLANLLYLKPTGIVLDLRELEYEWGNAISKIYQLLNYGKYPSVILISKKCETIKLEIMNWFFYDEESALQELSRRMKR